MKTQLEFSFQTQFAASKGMLPRRIQARGTLNFSAEQPTVALFGRSGVGKSTLLRWLAGIDRANGVLRFTSDTSEIWADSTRRVYVPGAARGLGYLSQTLALFPHLSARENILFGLSRWREDERQDRVDELLERFDLKAVSGLRPAALSGGQKQRVALARVLAPRPRLLLLDEPFTGLDLATRQTVLHEFRELIAHTPVPVLFVTHRESEAHFLSSQTVDFAVLEADHSKSMAAIV